MRHYMQLPLIALDSVLVWKRLDEMESDLSAFAPDVSVVGWQQEEDGITLVLEGDVSQVYDLINKWESGK